jgi:hypothetical protein
MSRYVYVWVLLAALPACGGDDAPGGPPAPTSLQVIAGTQQTAQVGQALPAPILVQVNAGNQPAVSVTVAFAVTAGGGRVNRASAVTDNLGQATVVWTLGGLLGSQSLTVSTTGLPVQIVTATAEAGPPTRIVPVAGNSQFAIVNSPVPVKPRVRLQDAFSNPLAGHTVTFSVLLGGGTITDSVKVTDAAGEVELGSWSLGPFPGSNLLRAEYSENVGTELLAIGTAAGIQVVSGNNQQANAGTQVPPRPTVRALGPDAEPLSEVPIVFIVTAGDGSVTGQSQTTDGQGIARVGSWTLGIAPGLNRITATTPGLEPLTFSATGVQAIAASMVATSPVNIPGMAGNFVSSNPSVRVTDAGGKPVAGLPVTFEVTSGSGVIASPGIGEAIGLLAAAGTTTDSAGHARLAAWRLGPTTGPQNITASVAGLTPITFTATAEPIPAGAYQIEVRFQGTQPTPSQQAAFTNAAARWAGLILGDVPDEVMNESAVPCAPALNETIDDVVIFAELENIDGPGGTLGQAGPCWYREGVLFPITGIMRFDTSDLPTLENAGLLEAVILHEMGHVIGFSPWFWEDMGLIVGGGTADPHFIGPSARSAWRFATQTLGFTGSIVPLENSGGAGTRDAHWRESIARNELMTGFIDAGINPLSAFTVSLFRDMGYVVNDTQSDTFSLSQLLQSVTASPLQLHEADLDSPLFTRGRDGRVKTRPRTVLFR